MSIPLTSPRFTAEKTRARFLQALDNKPTIKRGERDREAVRIIQQALIELRFPLKKSTAKYGTPDGDFGDETDTAVRAFQRREFPSETPDGKIGRNTLSRFDDLLPYAGAPLPPLVNPDDTNYDELGRQAILSVLTGGFLAKVHFRYRTQEINFGWFWKVKQLVEQEKIGVIFDPVVGDHGLAVYNPDNSNTTSGNCIVIPQVDFSSWKQRSVLVHECAHAIQDLQGQTLNRLESEAAAYVAQNMYYRLATGSKLQDSSPVAQAIHDAADPLARSAISRWYPTFSSTETGALERAVRQAGYLPEPVVFDNVR